MFLKQLSVFVENQSGRLADIAKIIGGEGIDIRAISVADTTDFGIVRLIVDRPDDAYRVLKENDVTVKLTDVLAVGIDDKPGAFADVLQVLCLAGMDVEYMYAFISRDDGKAMVILRVDDEDKARQVLSDGGIENIPADKIYNM